MTTGRSLVHVSISTNADGDPVLLCLCDCATATELTLEGLRVPPDSGREFAYTCDGCQTSHWLTLKSLAHPLNRLEP